MSDDLKKRGTQDDIRINVHQTFELSDWSKKFGVLPFVLKQAVSSVGPMVKDVREWLHEKGHIKAHG